MFQVIGSLLAFAAILSALAGAPVLGTLLAFSTVVWVVISKPRQPTPVQDVVPWSAAYQMPARR